MHSGGKLVEVEGVEAEMVKEEGLVAPLQHGNHTKIH